MLRSHVYVHYTCELVTHYVCSHVHTYPHMYGCVRGCHYMVFLFFKTFLVKKKLSKTTFLQKCHFIKKCISNLRVWKEHLDDEGNIYKVFSMTRKRCIQF